MGPMGRPARLVNDTAGPLGLAFCGLGESDQADRTIRHLLERPSLYDENDYIHMNKHSMPALGVFNALQLTTIYKKKYDWESWRLEMEKAILNQQDTNGSFYLCVLKSNMPKSMQASFEEYKSSLAPLHTAFAVAALSVPKNNAIWLKGK
jgi:hypothetical protein